MRGLCGFASFVPSSPSLFGPSLQSPDGPGLGRIHSFHKSTRGPRQTFSPTGPRLVSHQSWARKGKVPCRWAHVTGELRRIIEAGASLQRPPPFQIRDASRWCSQATPLSPRTRGRPRRRLIGRGPGGPVPPAATARFVREAYPVVRKCPIAARPASSWPVSSANR